MTCCFYYYFNSVLTLLLCVSAGSHRMSLLDDFSCSVLESREAKAKPGEIITLGCVFLAKPPLK